MSTYYAPEVMEKFTQLVMSRFHVSSDYAERLAIAALKDIESRGGNPKYWETVVETVNVDVASWVSKGTFKNHVNNQ